MIGGLTPNDAGGNDYPGSWRVPDPWTQGIGVFDIVALEWKDKYDAKALAYETPGVVREWYAKGQVTSFCAYFRQY